MQQKRMNNNFRNAIVIVLFFCLFFAGLGPNFFKGGEYEKHFSKAKGDCGYTYWDGDGCEKYPPLFGLLASPFSYNEKIFLYFVLFVFAIVTPLVIVHFSGHWISSLFYFTTTSYFFFFADGTLANGLAFLIAFVLFFVNKKHFLLNFILLLLISLSHSNGFFLGLIILFFKYFFDSVKEKAIFLCSGVFGNNKLAIMDEKVHSISNNGSAFEWGSLLNFFGKIYPIPFLYFSLKQLFDEKDYGLIFLVIFFFVMGVFSSFRIFYLIPLFLIPSLTRFYLGLSSWKKFFFVLLVLASGVFQFYSFLNLKILCQGANEAIIIG